MDIAGAEPTAGPVRDSPYFGLPTGYDIGITVAQRILEKRAALPEHQFTELTQLSNIRGFGEDKFADLVYSFGPTFYPTIVEEPAIIDEAPNFLPINTAVLKRINP